VQLSGTNPQALVRIGTVNEFDFTGDEMLYEKEDMAKGA
jgi:hypothetical protein